MMAADDALRWRGRRLNWGNLESLPALRRGRHPATMPLAMSLRILVVDDNEVIRGMLRFMLTRLGHAVVAEAGSGAEALAAYRAQRPDAVTLDISLPDMSGVDVLKAIRAGDRAAKIVVITGNNSAVLAKELAAAGAVQVIEKPFSVETLRACFERLGRGARP